MDNLPRGYFIVGNKLMTQCTNCGKIVRVDKPIFGGLHLCAPEEQLQQPMPKVFQQQNREVTAKS